LATRWHLTENSASTFEFSISASVLECHYAFTARLEGVLIYQISEAVIYADDVGDDSGGIEVFLADHALVRRLLTGAQNFDDVFEADDRRVLETGDGATKLFFLVAEGGTN